VNFHSLLNLEPDRERPIYVVLEPGGSAPLVRLDAIRRRQDWRYGVSVKSIPGRSPAVHDDAVRYAFPFGGTEPRRCSQGDHGKTSHWGLDALDFELPMGTPVVAARAGVVFHTQDGFGDGLPDDRFLDLVNQVTVLHEDGTVGSYGHLQRGLVVREGDVVAVGQLLGFSGTSGYSSGPHLHFEVDVPVFHHVVESVPILFVGDVQAVPGGWYPPTPELRGEPAAGGAP
jgi:murein DD-endopeptidase MepM/ murein hydrolase activator NlpD